jgi:hypothetical protein
MQEADLENKNNRDNFTRCKYCGKLSLTSECFLDEVKGYVCPFGCEETFEQPPYESILHAEDNPYTKKM